MKSCNSVGTGRHYVGHNKLGEAKIRETHSTIVYKQTRKQTALMTSKHRLWITKLRLPGHGRKRNEEVSTIKTVKDYLSHFGGGEGMGKLVYQNHKH